MTLLIYNRGLLNAFREGKKDAFYAVYQCYKKDVERFVSTGWISKKTKSRVAVGWDNNIHIELVQEVFLRAFSKNARLSYDGVRSYKNYLLSLARNVIVDYIQALPNDAITHVSTELDVGQIESDLTEAMENRNSLSESPEETLFWKQCVRAMREYVATLDEKRQRFVHLRFRQELPLLEIARRLGITRGKARHIENELGRNLKCYLEERNLSPIEKEGVSTTAVQGIPASTT